MAHERMLDRAHQPAEEEMLQVIGQPLSEAWTDLRNFLMDTYDITPIYNDGGKTYGWNLQHRKGGRPLCEMYPECGSFTALVILGKVELDQAIARIDEFGSTVRTALEKSPRFHDGCWMYIRISDPQTCQKDVRDIEQLVLLKKKPARKK